MKNEDAATKNEKSTPTLAEAAAKIANAPVNRVLPTHELSARQRRKKAVRLNPETKPEASQSRTVTAASLGSFFSQFPPRTPVE